MAAECEDKQVEDSVDSEAADRSASQGADETNCAWAFEMTADDRRAALAQEWENVRYQDRLRWSRIQTLTAIEGAALLAAYGNTPFELDPRLALIAAVIAFILVVVVTLLAIKDGRDARTHLTRKNCLERAMGVTPVVTLPFSASLCGQRLEVRGNDLMNFALALLQFFNLAVVGHLASRVAGWP